jgi:hypothetical protein
MKIDEAGTNDLARRVDYPIGGLRLVCADGFDLIILDENGTIGNNFMASAGPTDYYTAIDTHAHDDFFL